MTISHARVIGLDAHPDSFTSAIISGATPAVAVVEKVYNKVPIRQLASWAEKHTSKEDTIVLEASGNSFHIVRALAKVGRNAKVLESCQVGKLKDVHANNDKISAVRIGKAYLAGTVKIVWLPDPITQERRDIFHAYSKAVKRSTQLINRIKSYLSDNGVRLSSKTSLIKQQKAILQKHSWSLTQKMILEGLFADLIHAQNQKTHWNRLMAQQVLTDPVLLSLTRLTGIRDIVAYSVGAIIGDITRFANPKKLVSYVGLNPAFDDSGEEKWSGGIKGHGRRDIRSLLIEAAQSIYNSKHSLAAWGKKLLARKGSKTLAIAAIARKLTVAIYYILKGSWSPVEEVDSLMSAKIGKMITKLGSEGLAALETTRKDFRAQIFELLKVGRTYRLDPDKKYTKSPEPPAISSPLPVNA
jgi:transposase